MSHHCKSGKKSYPTAQDAWRVITLQKSHRWRATHKKRATPNGKVYRCDFCGQWHITADRRKPRVRARAVKSTEWLRVAS